MIGAAPDLSHPPFERMVVVLSSAFESASAIRVAAAVAEFTVPQTDVLFVEEEHLARVSTYSFAREIHSFGPVTRVLDETTLARDLRLAARQARSTVSSVAERSSLRWHFEIVRGNIAQTVAHASGHGTLIALYIGPETNIQKLIEDVAGAVSNSSAILLIRQGHQPTRGPILAYTHRSDLDEHVRSLAAQVARRSGQRVLEVVGDTHILPASHPAVSPTPKPSLAVIGADSLTDPRIALFRQASCPLLVKVR